MTSISTGHPGLSPLLNRPRLDRLMGEAGVDAILASSRNAIGYLTDMYLGMSDKFTRIQNYVIYVRGNDKISFCGELDWAMRGLLDKDLATLDLHLMDGAWYNSFHGEMSERDRKMQALMALPYSPELCPGDTGALIEAIRAQGLAEAVVGIEDKLPHSALAALRRAYPKLRIVLAQDVLDSTRAVKNALELDVIREATWVSHDALVETHTSLQAGMTAHEVEMLLRENMAKRGGEDLGADADIGPFPNRVPGYKLQPGDLVVLDAVNRQGRRFGDLGMSRVFQGEGSERLRNSHRALRNGIEAAVDVARPGITVSDLCRTIEAGIQAYYPGYSRSRDCYGHSLGVECPEVPILTIGNETVLEPGMTLNPDVLVYDYGLYMLLSENTLFVTENGCELVSPIEQTLAG